MRPIFKEAQDLEPGDILFSDMATRIGMVKNVYTEGGWTSIELHASDDGGCDDRIGCHADLKYIVQEWRPSQAV